MKKQMGILETMERFQHKYPGVYIIILGIIALLISVPVGIIVLEPGRSIGNVYQDPVFWLLFAWGIIWIIFGGLDFQAYWFNRTMRQVPT